MVVFGSIKLPSLNKVTLYGEDLVNSKVLKQYFKLGREQYVMFEEEEAVIGISVEGVVTLFTKASQEKIIDIIYKKIIPLSEPPPNGIF